VPSPPDDEHRPGSALSGRSCAGAGHATAYVVHGQPFKAVRVWEKVDGLVYGVTKTYGGQVDPLPHPVRVYAGPVAEGLYRAGGPPAEPPALVLPAYVDGVEHDKDEASEMRPSIVRDHAGRGVLWGMLAAVPCECLLPEDQGRMG